MNDSAEGLYTESHIEYVASISDKNLRAELLHQIRLRDLAEADRNAFENRLNPRPAVLTLEHVEKMDTVTMAGCSPAILLSDLLAHFKQGGEEEKREAP